MYQQNKVQSLGYLNTETIAPRGYLVSYGAIDKPHMPKRQSNQPDFRVVVTLTNEEKIQLEQVLAPFNQQVDAIFPSSQREQGFFKPETVSATDKTPTGNWVLILKNRFPVRVYDANNNEITPPPKVGKGSRVILNFSMLPYELNGLHGIARTRLTAIKVLELVDASSNPFGQSSGEQLIQPGQAQPQAPVNPYSPQMPVNPYMPQQPVNPYMPQQQFQQPVNPYMPQQQPVQHMNMSQNTQQVHQSQNSGFAMPTPPSFGQ